MPHTHGEVVGGRFGEPFIHIGIRILFKFHRGLGIADSHNGTVCGLGLSYNELKPAVNGLGAGQIGDGACAHLCLDGNAGACLPW